MVLYYFPSIDFKYLLEYHIIIYKANFIILKDNDFL